MKYWGGIYLTFGTFSKALVGCVMFDEEICESVIYDKPTIEKLLVFFPSPIDFEALTYIKPKEFLTRSYFDDYFRRYSNGMLQIKPSSIYSGCATDEDLKKFANAIFGKISNWEDLIIYKKQQREKEKLHTRRSKSTAQKTN